MHKNRQRGGDSKGGIGCKCRSNQQAINKVMHTVPEPRCFGGDDQWRISVRDAVNMLMAPNSTPL